MKKIRTFRVRIFCLHFFWKVIIKVSVDLFINFIIYQYYEDSGRY